MRSLPFRAIGADSTAIVAEPAVGAGANRTAPAPARPRAWAPPGALRGAAALLGVPGRVALLSSRLAGAAKWSDADLLYDGPDSQIPGAPREPDPWWSPAGNLTWDANTPILPDEGSVWRWWSSSVLSVLIYLTLTVLVACFYDRRKASPRLPAVRAASPAAAEYEAPARATVASRVAAAFGPAGGAAAAASPATEAEAEPAPKPQCARPPADGLEHTVETASHGWRYGPFSCLDDAEVCCWTCCCAPIRWADTARMLGFFTFWGALALWCGLVLLDALTLGACFWAALVALQVHVRQRMRAAFRMDSHSLGSCVEDCLLYLFCPCCAICQEARQVELAGSIEHPAVKVLPQ